MRILITKNGVACIEDLSSVVSTKSKSPKRNVSQQHTKKRKLVLNNNNYNDTVKMPSIINTINNKDQVKVVKYLLKNSKINFPKSFFNKYDESVDDGKSNIISSFNNLPSIGNTSLLSKMNAEQNNLISFKDIIPSSTINNLKKSMLTSKFYRDKATVIDENKFRSSYNPQSEINKLNEIITFPVVHPGKTSLIQYLNEKKNISPITLTNLYESQPERLNRYNKMCQILIHNREHEKLFLDRINEKLEHKLNEVKIDSQKQISQMKNDILEEMKTLGNYNKKINHKAKYMDRHNEIIKKYWENKDYERFNKKGRINTG